MATVRSPYFKIVYNTVDITEDISPDVLKLIYSDATEGEANEIRITLHDFSGKWKNEWLMNTGARLNVQIGYSQDDLLDCGDFQIDEIDYNGAPDTVEIKCMSIGEDNSMWEEDSAIFENQTVRQIIEQVASKNGMSVVTTAEYSADQSMLAWEKKILAMKIGRVVQNRETDISFLHRITKKYGLSFIFGNEVDGAKNIYVFVRMTLESISPTVFLHYSEAIPDNMVLDNGNPVEDVGKIQLKSYSLKNCSKNTISSVELKYENPVSDELWKYRTEYDNLPAGGKINPFQLDIPEIAKKKKEYASVENQQQAEAVAASVLYDTLSKQVEGDMYFEGNTNVVAGVALSVDGLGKLSGRYFVTKSTHIITRAAGYTTNAQVKFMGSA